VKKLTEGHYHEICDRSHVFMNMIDEHLSNYLPKDPYVKKEADKAIKHLCNIYVHAGNKF